MRKNICKIYKPVLLDLFLRGIGEGFSTVIEKYTSLKNDNLKQKRRKMRGGDYKSYREIVEAVLETRRMIKEGFNTSGFDDTFLPEWSSEKYYHSFSCFEEFLGNCSDTETFFYESFENALSYMIAKVFYTEQSNIDYKSVYDTNDLNCAIETHESEKQGYLERFPDDDWRKERIADCDKRLQEAKETFRPEYKSALLDVRLNKKGNKTFFKWCIDEFYNTLDKEKGDEILSFAFAKKNGAYSLISKLKYERKIYRWSTFEKLFMNEHKDSALMKMLNTDSLLEAYQVFQSRMFVAFFLENLCLALPDFVGEDNAKLLIKIIESDEDRKTPNYFLIAEHKEKTGIYNDVLRDILFENYQHKYAAESLRTKLANLDKNCMATKTFIAYFSLRNEKLYSEMTYNEKIKDLYTVQNEYSVFDRNTRCFEWGYRW